MRKVCDQAREYFFTSIRSTNWTWARDIGFWTHSVANGHAVDSSGHRLIIVTINLVPIQFITLQVSFNILTLIWPTFVHSKSDIMSQWFLATSPYSSVTVNCRAFCWYPPWLVYLAISSSIWVTTYKGTNTSGHDIGHHSIDRIMVRSWNPVTPDFQRVSDITIWLESIIQE